MKRVSEGAETGPVAESVHEKRLVSKNVRAKDILDHHAAYFKDTHKVLMDRTVIKVRIYYLLLGYFCRHGIKFGVPPLRSRFTK